MAVLIPGKFLYLATPHTASVATTHALAQLPEAKTTRLGGLEKFGHLPVAHHATRKDVEPYLTGTEVVVTTIRNPHDLVVTWWVRQQGAVKHYLGPGATFLDFVKNVDKVIGPSGPFLQDGQLFWHDVDRVLRYENLETDLNSLLVELNLPIVTLELKNVTKDKEHWRSYYDEESFEVVRARFEKELKHFGGELVSPRE